MVYIYHELLWFTQDRLRCILLKGYTYQELLQFTHDDVELCSAPRVYIY